jgi:uncharacterized protein (DUF1501 family)
MSDIFILDEFASNIKILKKLILGIPHLPFIKFTHAGYDTHSNQVDTHEKLLIELNNGLSDLISFLRLNNRWNDTLIVTYSEFGRAPIENSSMGTDHGTLSCHFVMGGRVKGGLYGKYPLFSEIENFQFVNPIDYRTMFSSIMDDFWKIDSSKVFNKKFENLGFVKT